MTIGRPTKYDETWPVKLAECMLKGYTVEMFCYETRIAKTTFHDWLKKYPDFNYAFREGKTDSEAFHQFYIKNNLENKNLQPAVLKLFMQNCFGWKDKREVEQTVEHSLHEKDLAELDDVKKAYKKDL